MTGIHKRIFLIFLLAAGLHSFVPANALAASSDDARNFVNDVGSKVLTIVNASGDEAGKKQQLQQMFSQYVDIPWMGRFVLGHSWQEATPDQRNHYLQAYKNYLLARYTTNFANYNGSKYIITGARDEGDGTFTVDMKIKTPQQSQDTLAGYRLAYENGQFKIHDIVIEGVSLITTQRSEFASVVQREGMDGLIKDIENKTQAKQASSHS